MRRIVRFLGVAIGALLLLNGCSQSSPDTGRRDNVSDKEIQIQDTTYAEEQDTLLQIPEKLTDMRRPDMKVRVRKGSALCLETEGFQLVAVDTAVKHTREYSVTSLQEEDIAPLPQGMKNMTAATAGYRLLPSGEHFSPYAELHVAYDPERLPFGYTPEDIYTSYYDTSTMAWVRLERLFIDTVNHEIVSATTHFTDFINELLKAPEMPETQAFVPTQMSDLEAVNPLTGFTLIAAPQPNNMGTANLTYPFQIPVGRGNVQPSLGLTYNSNGGNGVCGMGWDFSVPCVSVETRWGVPLYDMNKESETYLLNGEQLLVSYDSLPAFARPYENRINGDVRFYSRVEGAFDSIIRYGSSPHDYWWKVYDRSGSQYIYGNSFESTLHAQQSQGIAQWYLSQVSDRNGNTARYYYRLYNKSSGGSTSGIHHYLDRVEYTLPPNGTIDSSWYGYSVTFYYGEGRPDPVISGNYGVKDNICLRLDSVKTWYIRKSKVCSLTVDSIYSLLQPITNPDPYYSLIEKLYDDLLYGRITSEEFLESIPAGSGLPMSVIQTDSSLVRGYRFLYSTSPTGKTLLSAAVEMSPSEWSNYGHSVTLAQLNNPGTILKYHRFSYRDTNGIVAFESPENFNTSVNNGLSGLPQVFPSPLGGNSDWNSSVNISAGIGLGEDAWHRTYNIEGTGNITPYSTNRGRTLLTDINGDGYPDIIYTANGDWKYQLFSPTGAFYGPAQTLNLEPNAISLSSSNGLSLGVALNTGKEYPQGSSGGINVGIQSSFFHTNNSVYLTDVNADGLPDIVSDGQVWFNNSHGDNISFGETYIPYTTEGGGCDTAYYTLRGAIALYDSIFEAGHESTTRISKINDSLVGEQYSYTIGQFILDTLPERIYDSLYRSVVRVWVAPQEGTVSITGTATLDNRFAMARVNTESDGVHVSIQHNSDTLAGTGHDLTNSTPQTMNYSSLAIHKNDRIYFRVESLKKCDYDVVNWNPVITYTDENTSERDVEGRRKYIFEADTDFLAWQKEYFYMPSEGYVDINANYTLTKPMHDTIRLRILRCNNNGTPETCIDSAIILPGSQPSNGSLSKLNYLLSDSASIRFEAFSKSDVDWTKLQWNPHIRSLSFTNPDIPASVVVYNELSYPTTVYTIDRYPSPSYSFYDTCMLPNEMRPAIFKSFNRGWSAFEYNDTAVRKPIIENFLKQDQRYDSSFVARIIINDPTSITGDTINKMDIDKLSENLTDSLPNPAAARASMMNAEYDENFTTRIWMGYAYRSFVTSSQSSMYNRKTMQAALTHQELLNPTTNRSVAQSGVTAVGPIKESTRSGWSFYASASAGLDLHNNDSIGANIRPSICYNYSEGTHELLSDFIDMNGDGYPDIVGENDVQYSRSMGGLSTKTAGIALGGRGIQVTAYDAYSLQGGASYADYKKNNKAKPSVSVPQRTSGLNIGATVDFIASSGDYQRRAWIDMNGDGLPDCVHDGKVNLNLGYDYYNEEPMESNPLPKNVSKNYPVRASANYEFPNSSSDNMSNSSTFTTNHSFSAGISTSESSNEGVVTYSDINGDGLVDKIVNENEVYFNTGWGFRSSSYNLSQDAPTKDISHNMDLNGNLTFGIPVPFFWGITLKIQGTVGASIGNSVHTTENALIDMNADGLPDLVSRNGQSGQVITVRYNRLYDVDKLVSVDAFYGNCMKIDYSQSDYSPNARTRPTVMASLRINDTLGTSSDIRKYTFEYSGYTHSIAERTPYGFSDVIITQYVRNNNSEQPYRVTRQHYRTDTYKMRGKKESERIEDDNGNYYVENKWKYNLKQISDGERVPVEMQHCFEATWPALDTVEVLYFEPTSNTVKVKTIEYYEHEGYGRVSRYVNRNNVLSSDDDLICEILYTQRDSNQNALPQEIKIFDNSNQLLRHRELDYSPSGMLSTLTLHNLMFSSVTNYYYDQYGNLVHVLLPQNNAGQRAEFRYNYDRLMHMFRISTKDSVWGDESRADYDVRLGVPLRVYSVGGDSISYTYDDWGRPLTVRAPLESDTLAFPTIRHSYWDNAQPSPQLKKKKFPSSTGIFAVVGLLPTPNCNYFSGGSRWAQTQHKSYLDQNLNASTVIFVDGHGRVLQTRKTAVVDGTPTYVASGHILYDDVGRSSKSYEAFVTSTLYCQYASPVDTGLYTKTDYDILDRITETSIPSQSIVTTTAYDFANISGVTHFLQNTIDPNGIVTSSIIDARGLTLKNIDGLFGQTLFEYTTMGQLKKATDPDGFSTTYIYDNLGQLSSRSHPDAGTTSYIYDPAGHVIQENNSLGLIDYSYSYQRLSGKQYSYLSSNNTSYTYGLTGRNRGQLVTATNGSVVRQYDYDALGHIKRESSTIAIPGDDRSYCFINENTYDSWGRIISMKYPDGEIVSYDYNTAGDLFSMRWQKGNASDDYISNILYNKFGQRTNVLYGNNTHAEYRYDPLHRLVGLKGIDHFNNKMQDLIYQFDNVGNIVQIRNLATPITYYGSLGGPYENTYMYDGLYRLTKSSGNGFLGNYITDMQYTPGGRLGQKQSTTVIPGTSNTLNLSFGYCNSYQPHAPKRIMDTKSNELFDLQWDEGGNLSRINYVNAEGQWAGSRYLFWTEENQMYSAIDREYYSYYAYDHQGERALKLTGLNNEIDVNAERQRTGAILNDPTLYPSPYIVMGSHGYTKHYYAGTERVCAKIGDGFDVTIAENNPNLQGTSLGVFNQGQRFIKERDLSMNDVNCIYSYGSVSNQYLQKDIKDMPEKLQASSVINLVGFHQIVEYYEKRPSGEELVYYYHGDHLGSASWITDHEGHPVQHLQYLPFGESFINQHSTSYQERFTFTGKERDEETGYGYFGARYMDHELMTMWLSVDPMADKYPSISPYNYCMWNPIKLVDPNGMDTIISLNLKKPDKKAYYTADNYNAANEIYEKNMRLAKYARQYKNTSDVIHVFAHGLVDKHEKYLNMMVWANGEKVSPIELMYKMTNGGGSKVYLENEYSGKGSVIMLHSCSAGHGKNSFAQQFSEFLPNCLIIAPSDNIKVYKSSTEYVQNGGCWRFFYNGEMIFSLPGSSAFTNMLERILEQMGSEKILELIKKQKQK